MLRSTRVSQRCPISPFLCKTKARGPGFLGEFRNYIALTRIETAEVRTFAQRARVCGRLGAWAHIFARFRRYPDVTLLLAF